MYICNWIQSTRARKKRITLYHCGLLVMVHRNGRWENKPSLAKAMIYIIIKNSHNQHRYIYSKLSVGCELDMLIAGPEVLPSPWDRPFASWHDSPLTHIILTLIKPYPNHALPTILLGSDQYHLYFVGLILQGFESHNLLKWKTDLTALNDLCV